MKALNLNPVVLILINIIAPSMYIFINGKYLQYFLFVFAFTLLMLMGRFKNVIALSAVWMILIGLNYIAIRFGIMSGTAMFFAILAQSVPCAVLAFVLIGKYTSAELLSALETLHIPRVLVVAVTITLKYIPTFKREFGYITESMRLRGITFTLKKPIRSFKYFIIPQLFRCAALAEEVSAAGLVKGIDAPIRRSSYYEEKIRLSDALVLLVFAAGIVGGFIWQSK